MGALELAMSVKPETDFYFFIFFRFAKKHNARLCLSLL